MSSNDCYETPLCFVSGQSVYGQLSDIPSSRFNKIEKFTRFKHQSSDLAKEIIQDVYTGDHFIIFQTKSNRLFGVGQNNCGQMALPSEDKNPLKEITFFKENNLTVKCCYCGSNFTFFVCTNGKIYGSGENGSRQLGIDKQDKIYVPEEVTINLDEGDKIKQIAGGFSSSMLCTTKGFVYGAGSGNTSQFFNTKDSYSNFTKLKVDYLLDAVGLGTSYCAGLTKCKKLIAYHYMLGHETVVLMENVNSFFVGASALMWNTFDKKTFILNKTLEKENTKKISSHVTELLKFDGILFESIVGLTSFLCISDKDKHTYLVNSSIKEEPEVEKLIKLFENRHKYQVVTGYNHHIIYFKENLTSREIYYLNNLFKFVNNRKEYVDISVYINQ